MPLFSDEKPDEAEEAAGIGSPRKNVRNDNPSTSETKEVTKANVSKIGSPRTTIPARDEQEVEEAFRQLYLAQQDAQMWRRRHDDMASAVRNLASKHERLEADAGRQAVELRNSQEHIVTLKRELKNAQQNNSNTGISLPIASPSSPRQVSSGESREVRDQGVQTRAFHISLEEQGLYNRGNSANVGVNSNIRIEFSDDSEEDRPNGPFSRTRQFFANCLPFRNRVTGHRPLRNSRDDEELNDMIGSTLTQRLREDRPTTF
jgi:hypothetical protein